MRTIKLSLGLNQSTKVMNMIINCNNLLALSIVCAQLVREGVTFKADTSDLTITLTGGL